MVYLITEVFCPTSEKLIISTPTNSVCTRCGKVRVVSKKWTEKVDTYAGTTTITRTETVCPDPKCQIVVAEEIKKQQLEREMLQKESEIRAQERIALKNRNKKGFN